MSHGHSHGFAPGACRTESDALGGGGGGEGNHTHDPEDPGGNSLFGAIDREQIRALNEAEDGMGKNPFKPYDKRHESEPFLASDEDDPELIVHVPFTQAVDIRSLCIVGGGDGGAPTSVRLYVDRDDLDFSMAEDLPPVQTIELQQDFNADVWYPLQVRKFQSVQSVALHFPDDNFGGGDGATVLCYVGFKGAKKDARRGIVECTYEASAQVKDHKKAKDEMGASAGVS